MSRRVIGAMRGRRWLRRPRWRLISPPCSIIWAMRNSSGAKISKRPKLILRASQLRPKDSAILDYSLGWVYYVRGNLPKAIETLERAVQGQPDEPTINEHLGDAYWAAGRRIDARYAWRAALLSADAPGSDGCAARSISARRHLDISCGQKIMIKKRRVISSLCQRRWGRDRATQSRGGGVRLSSCIRSIAAGAALPSTSLRLVTLATR